MLEHSSSVFIKKENRSKTLNERLHTENKKQDYFYVTPKATILIDSSSSIKLQKIVQVQSYESISL